jgi:hypothetical protein
MSLSSLRARLTALAAHVPTPTAPLVPVVLLGDGGPPPAGCRWMNSEETLRDLERFLRGEPNPHTLSPAQEAEITRRFEAVTGGVENVERWARAFLAELAQDASTESGNGEAPGVST